MEAIKTNMLIFHISKWPLIELKFKGFTYPSTQKKKLKWRLCCCYCRCRGI